MRPVSAPTRAPGTIRLQRVLLLHGHAEAGNWDLSTSPAGNHLWVISERLAQRAEPLVSDACPAERGGLKVCYVAQRVPCSAIHDQIHARNRGEVSTLPAEFWRTFYSL